MTFDRPVIPSSAGDAEHRRDGRLVGERQYQTELTLPVPPTTTTRMSWWYSVKVLTLSVLTQGWEVS
jgi:hypothetical protein